MLLPLFIKRATEPNPAIHRRNGYGRTESLSYKVRTAVAREGPVSFEAAPGAASREAKPA